MEFEPDDTMRVLRCNHAEHAECLEPWLEINKSCPLCQCEVQIGAPPASTLDKALVGTPPTPASLPVETPLAGLTSAPVEPLADANTNVDNHPVHGPPPPTPPSSNGAGRGIAGRGRGRGSLRTLSAACRRAARPYRTNR